MDSGIKWGLITGGVYIAFSLVSNLLGIQDGTGGNTALSFGVNTLMFAATFFTIFQGIKEARDTELGGYLVMGQAVRKGMKIALIAAVISALFAILYMTVIDPEMTDKIMANAEAEWDKNNMPEENREMARKMTGYFTNPLILAPFVLIYTVFWGLIKSLISGAILKRVPPMS